jgi:hypothetical protein
MLPQATQPVDRYFTFDGHIIVRVQCNRATNEIYMSTANLTFGRVLVQDEISGEMV